MDPSSNFEKRSSANLKRIQRRSKGRKSMSHTEDEELNQEPSTNLQAPSQLTEEAAKNKRMRDNVVRELVDTERKYLSDLYTLLVYYIRPLKLRFPEILKDGSVNV